jgi:hypothetical protein
VDYCQASIQIKLLETLVYVVWTKFIWNILYLVCGICVLHKIYSNLQVGSNVANMISHSSSRRMRMESPLTSIVNWVWYWHIYLIFFAETSQDGDVSVSQRWRSKKFRFYCFSNETTITQVTKKCLFLYFVELWTGIHEFNKLHSK